MPATSTASGSGASSHASSWPRESWTDATVGATRGVEIAQRGAGS